MANRFFNNNCFTLHKMPTLLDVAVTFGASGAVSSFAGLGIKSVSKLANGVYQVQLQDAYASLWGMDFNCVGAPTIGQTFTASTTLSSNVLSALSSVRGLAVGQAISGTNIPAGSYIGSINSVAGTLTMVTSAGAASNATATGSGITVTVSAAGIAGGSFLTGALYQILTLGNTTQAQWAAAGLPSGVSPAVGQAFVATGAGAGTGTVSPVVPSQIVNVELAGTELSGLGQSVANQMLSPAVVGNAGPSTAYITVMTLDASNVIVNPTNGAVIQMCFYLGNSSSPVNGIYG